MPVARAADGRRASPGSRDRGLRIVAARVDAARSTPTPTSAGRVAIVLGSEAAGLSRRLARRATSSPSRLPMHGVADSLNVSVAAAVLLYEARRQRAPRADARPAAH